MVFNWLIGLGRKNSCGFFLRLGVFALPEEVKPLVPTSIIHTQLTGHTTFKTD
jgi:hypothetical protein